MTSDKRRLITRILPSMLTVRPFWWSPRSPLAPLLSSRIFPRRSALPVSTGLGAGPRQPSLVPYRARYPRTRAHRGATRTSTSPIRPSARSRTSASVAIGSAWC